MLTLHFALTNKINTPVHTQVSTPKLTPMPMPDWSRSSTPARPPEKLKIKIKSEKRSGGRG